MMILVTGLIGMALMATFLGIMVWWIKALPLAIIVAVVVALAVHDLVRTLRYGENGSTR